MVDHALRYDHSLVAVLGFEDWIVELMGVSSSVWSVDDPAETMRSIPDPSGGGNASTFAGMEGELDIASCDESCAATSENFCDSTVSSWGNIDESDTRMKNERVSRI